MSAARTGRVSGPRISLLGETPSFRGRRVDGGLRGAVLLTEHWKQADGGGGGSGRQHTWTNPTFPHTQQVACPVRPWPSGGVRLDAAWCGGIKRSAGAVIDWGKGWRPFWGLPGFRTGWRERGSWGRMWSVRGHSGIRGGHTRGQGRAATDGATTTQANHAQVLGAAREGRPALRAGVLWQRHAGRFSDTTSIFTEGPWLLSSCLSPRGARRQDVEEVVEDWCAANWLRGQEGSLAEVRHLHTVHRNLRVLLVLKPHQQLWEDRSNHRLTTHTVNSTHLLIRWIHYRRQQIVTEGVEPHQPEEHIRYQANVKEAFWRASGKWNGHRAECIKNAGKRGVCVT